MHPKMRDEEDDSVHIRRIFSRILGKNRLDSRFYFTLTFINFNAPSFMLNFFLNFVANNILHCTWVILFVQDFCVNLLHLSNEFGDVLLKYCTR